jgi:hypothetical protein
MPDAWSGRSRRWSEDTRPLVYVVTDVEADGGDPASNSLRALCSITVSEQGGPAAVFDAVLQRRGGAVEDPDTMAFYARNPAAWRAALANPRDPALVMRDYVAWVKGLPGQPVFVAHPLTFDGLWVDAYLRRYTQHVLFRGPFQGETLFAGGGLDLASLAMGAAALPYRRAWGPYIPADWRGNIPQTHRSRDDAEGHAALLRTLLGKVRETLRDNLR